MKPSTFFLAPFALSAACALEPAPDLAPRGPDAPPAAPTVLAPADPSLADPSSVARTGRRGPSAVSGAAWRSERGELHAHILYQQTEAPARRLHARLLDAMGTAIETPEPVLLPSPDRSGRGIGVLRLAANEQRAAVHAVELTLEDGRGVRSVPFEIEVTAFRGVRDGERCMNELGLDECDVGSFCGPSRVCSPPVAPTLVRAEAYRGADGRSGVRLSWDDPNGDVGSLEVGTNPRCPPTYDLAGRVEARVRDAEFRWPTDVFQGRDRIALRLRDRGGSVSERLEVVVTAPATLADGAPCDPSNTTTRCGDASVCTRYGATSCDAPRCQPDVRACPSTMNVVPLEGSFTRDWTLTFTDAQPESYGARPSLCDRDLGAERAYVFRAPTAATWRFTVAAESAEYARLAVRTRCAIGDVGARQTEGAASQIAPVELALQAGEEAYVLPFASRRGSSPLRLTVARVR